MNIWEILQIIWEKKIRKRLYPYSAHWARDRHGPAQLRGWQGDVEGAMNGVRLRCAESGFTPGPSPLKRAGTAR